MSGVLYIEQTNIVSWIHSREFDCFRVAFENYEK